MSKQQTSVTKTLKLLYSDLESEVTLNKITGVFGHKNIRVDIWIPSINCICEVNGIQHFKPSGFGKNKIESQYTLHDQERRDSRLIEVCKQFGINYEQIDYTEKVNMAMLFKRFSKYEKLENG